MSGRMKVVIVLSGMIVAQFFSYRDLRNQLGRTVAKLQEDKQILSTENAKLQGTITEKDSRIENLTNKLEDAIHKKSIEVRIPNLKVIQPQAEPPIVEGLRYTQRRVASPKTEAPYALEITIQASATIQPVGLLIECDGPIQEGSFHVVGQGIYTMTSSGVVENNPNQFFLKFSSPPLTPQTPLVVKLLSKSAIRVEQIRRVQTP